MDFIDHSPFMEWGEEFYRDIWGLKSKIFIVPTIYIKLFINQLVIIYYQILECFKLIDFKTIYFLNF
jgi:hypothetical protein